MYIGLMSGTSLDGVDAVLADFSGAALRVHAHAHQAFDPVLKAELLALNQAGANELHRAALAANALVRHYAQTVHVVLQQSGIAMSNIQAIGAHGQTVRHRPGEFDGVGYTWQLNAPALLAELTGITVVADFRSRDIAAGGQGAPLVPAFHQALFADAAQHVAVLNLGGIANLTLLPPHGPVGGFDCGPANALMDAWCQQHQGQDYDAQGQWAASGQIQPALLQALLAHPYFERQPPKSTGRDDFHLPWLHSVLQKFPSTSPVDVQATLAALCVHSCAQDLQRYAPATQKLIVCGGGALNTHLMQGLQSALPQVQVTTSQVAGLNPTQVEAAAFAWLAHQTLTGQAGNLASVTGAKGPRILGAVYTA